MQYLVQRLLSAIPVVLGISIIVFLIISLIPGDPATAILGSFATPDNVAKLNKDLGLDRGLFERYFIWLGNLMQGDFGRSYALNRPVIDEILERFNATLILSGTAFVLCSLFCVARFGFRLLMYTSLAGFGICSVHLFCWIRLPIADV